VDEYQNNKLIFMKNVSDNEVIELIEPLNEKSTIYKCKKGYHHICYEVNALEDFLNEFKEKKVGIVFTQKIIAPAFGHKNIVFAYLKNGTIIEFLESGESKNDEVL
jgi:catechol 2,3-dioxygenase-like lactoylglutathione lyase family enzyme